MTPIITFIKKLLRRSRQHHKPIHASYVIPRTHHSLSKTDLSINALKVLNRLNGAGFQAFLVGGSVRDLLLGKVPKDFDVATNATPNQIKQLFRNARIIGRRFKLVHIIFHRDIIEVATFRGEHEEQNNVSLANSLTNEQGMLVRDNHYGTLDQDAWRRDFTINSLYYNLDDASIVDFTGGVSDIEAKCLRVIGNPLTRYQEDPVRMLRAIRFAAKLHFELDPETADGILQLGHLIKHVSGSRLFDEVTKLYQCGETERVQQLLLKYGLFQYLFAQTSSLLQENESILPFIEIALQNTDTRIRDNKPVTPAFLLAVLLWFPLNIRIQTLQQDEQLTPLAALEKAMLEVIVEQNKVVAIPKRFSQVVREIWLLQFRFSKRAGGRAFNLLQHPRFRAAYDFMALRALAGDESMELAQWWTTFQEVSDEERTLMVSQFKLPTRPHRSKKRPPAK